MKQFIISLLLGIACLPAFAQLDVGICQGFKIVNDASATPDIITVSTIDLGNDRVFTSNADNKKPLDGKYHLILDDGKYSIVNFKKGILDGDWVLYWNGNNVEMKGSFKDGKRDGVFIANNSDLFGGHTELTYKDGILQREQDWHSNGKLKDSINCDENGQINGAVIEYDENGNIAAKRTYSHGKKVGLQMQKDDEGYTETYTLKNEATKTGAYCKRYPNGNIEKMGTYDDNGNGTGTWYEGEENGDTVSIAYYGDDGNSYLKIYANGKPWEYTEYTNGIKNGKYIKYSVYPPYGALLELTYKNNLVEGDKKVYDNNSVLKEIDTYDNDYLVTAKFYENGKLVRMQKIDADGVLDDVPLPADATTQSAATVKTKPAQKSTPKKKSNPQQLKEDASGIIDAPQ